MDYFYRILIKNNLIQKMLNKSIYSTVKIKRDRLRFV